MMYWSKDISFICSHNFVPNPEDSKTTIWQINKSELASLKKELLP